MALNINDTKLRKCNVNGVKCKRINFNGVKVWSATPDYIYNGGWADSDIIKTGSSLKTEVVAYSVAPNPVTSTITVCEIDVTDIAKILGSFWVRWEQVDDGTVAAATAVIKLDGNQIGWQRHNTGSVWEGSSNFSIDVSEMTGWKVLTLEVTAEAAQGDASMNGGSGARVKGATGITVINCTAL